MLTPRLDVCMHVVVAAQRRARMHNARGAASCIDCAKCTLRTHGLFICHSLRAITAPAMPGACARESGSLG
jgi:hypothetical protein